MHIVAALAQAALDNRRQMAEQALLFAADGKVPGELSRIFAGSKRKQETYM